MIEALLALDEIDVPSAPDAADEFPSARFADLRRSRLPRRATPVPRRRSAGPASSRRRVRRRADGAAPIAAPARRRCRRRQDDIDVVDAIDPDLFPIFEEEAAELLPQLGGALRQWAARPDNRSARDEVLRALHTLKGSARLAGALRLGELAHRMESEIEYAGLRERVPPPTSNLCCTASTAAGHLRRACAPPAARAGRGRAGAATLPAAPAAMPPRRRQPPPDGEPRAEAGAAAGRRLPRAPCCARPAATHAGAAARRPPTRRCASARSCSTAW